MGLQFESLVLHSLPFLWQRCGLSPAEVARDGPFFQTATARRQGCQIDYLVQTTQGPIFLFEFKYHRDVVRAGVTKEVEDKLRKLVKPRHTSIFPVLVHVNGVAPKVVDSGVFTRIIDFGEALVPKTS